MKAFFSIIACLFSFSTQAIAADVKVLSLGAFRGILPTLAPIFERTSGHRLTFEIFTPVVLTDRLLKGEPGDVALTVGARLPPLEKAAKIVSESRVELGGAYVAVVIRAGTAKPDLGTPDAVKRTLRAAKSVAISDPSGGAVQGRFVMDLMDRFNFDQELRSRFKLIPGGGNNVAEAVVRGEADIGITLSTEIVFVKGAEIGGPLPPDMQNLAVFYAVLLTASRQPKAGRDFTQFMLTPEARRITKEFGVEPR